MTAQQDVLLRKLCQRWKSAIPEVAIVRAVEAAFPELAETQPPIDPSYLATRRGITQIIAADMQFDGVIFRIESGEYSIQYRRGLSESRKRFTLAHELGHTLFFDLEEQVRSRFRVEDTVEALYSQSGEEYLCNVAASEILMPAAQFSSRMLRHPPTARAVLALSKDFGVSIHATAHRIVQLSPYRLAICLWGYHPRIDSYETLWVVSRSAQSGSGRALFQVPRSEPLFKVLSTGGEFSGRSWVSLGGPRERYYLDGIQLQGIPPKWLVVFVLEKHAERLVATPSREPGLDAAQTLF